MSTKENNADVSIPTLDLGPYLDGDTRALDVLAARLCEIQENIGFKESVVIACDINAKKRTPWEKPDYSESQIYTKFILSLIHI